MGGIARKSGMTLTIHLQIIGMHAVDDILNHRRRCVLAHRGAIGSRVKIKMNSEKTIGAF